MKTKFVYISIFLLAIAVRLFRINEVPMGLAWDEASIIYNSWSISQWHRDENAQLMPLAFKSFGDYKPPFVFYWMAGQYKIFGLVPDLLRINGALFGLGSVVLIWLMGEEVFSTNSNNKHLFGLMCFFLATITPWGVHFSRLGFEQIFAWFWVNLGVYLMMKWRGDWKCLFGSVMSFVISLYTFHSSRVFVPAWLLFFGWLQKKRVNKYKRQVGLMVGLMALLLMPLATASLNQQALARAETLIIFDGSKLRSAGLIARDLVENIWNQLSPAFWIGGQDAVSIRHSVPGWGVLLKVQYLLWLLGVVYLLREKKNWWILSWLGLGLLPAVIAKQTPHAMRSLFALTPSVLIMAFGWMWIWERMRKNWVHLVVVGLLLVEFGFYMNQYYGVYARESAVDFQYGYEQLIKVMRKYEEEVEKTVVTDAYGQVYVYFLMFEKIHPQDYLWGALSKYEFRSINWPEEGQNRLYVGTPDEIPVDDKRVISVVKVPGSEKVVFVMARS